jgi:hypothetical protein
MKRFISMILIVVVLLLSLSVPVWAESTDDGVGVEPVVQYRKSVLLWGADESFGGRFEIDTQNQLEGQGCASIDVSLPEGKHIAQRSIDPVDATGMDTLEFDVYLSSTDFINLLGTALRSGDFEIASKNSGALQAFHLDWQRLVYYIKQANPTAGWNHVIIPLEVMKIYYGNVDVSCLNHISMSWVKYEDIPEGSVIKFDQFILTDRQATAEEQEAQADSEELRYAMQLAAEHAELLTNMQRFCTESLDYPKEYRTNPTLDSSSMMLRYEALSEQYQSLPTGEQRLLNQYFDYYRNFRTASVRVHDYDRARSVYPAIQVLVSEVVRLKQFTDESALNRGNYKSVCERVERLTESIHALPTLELSVMEDQGYTAILYDVKKVLKNHTHRYARLPDEASLAHAATCTEGALYYKQCELCGKLDTETYQRGEPCGHTPLSDFAFSAGEKGHGQMCRDCVRIMNPVAHEFADWRTVREATPQEQGLQERKCLSCTYVETQELAYVAPEEPTDEKNDKGCFSVLSGGACLCVALTLPLAAALRKKKT